MDATPHTHELKIEPSKHTPGAFWVEYGDQNGWVGRGPFKDWRMRRRIRKVIAKHDRESVKAGHRQVQHDRYRELTTAYSEEHGTWGSERVT